MEDLELDVLKTCCDRMGLTLSISVIISKNENFCSIIIDGLLLASVGTIGRTFCETVNETIKKAMRTIHQVTGLKQSEHVAERTNIDFDTELRRMLPLFKIYMTNSQKRVHNFVSSEQTVAKPYNNTSYSSPIDAQNYYSTKSYTTTMAVVPVKLEPLVPIKIESHVPVKLQSHIPVKLKQRQLTVVKREMLQTNNNLIDKNNIGFKMLLGLGWKGGPLGANKDGIAEPISVDSRSDRRGFGFAGGQSFAINSSHLFDYLKEYADDDQQFDILEFSDDFSFKEKKLLIGISKDLNLQHVTEHRNGMPVIKIKKLNRNN